MLGKIPDNVIDFLKEGGPEIKWQVLHDLTDGEKDDIHLQRIYIEYEGIGKEIIDQQGDDGLWDNSLMKNKWTSTLWQLIALRRFGVYPLDQFLEPSKQLVESLLHYTGGIKDEVTEEVHVCLSGLVLGVATYFKYRSKKIEAIYHYLIETQSADGSWTCTHHDDPKQLRFATTLAVLEGLMEYQKVFKQHDSHISQMQYQAHEFLLNHKLFLKGPDSHDKLNGAFKFPFPFFNYDVLTALDYLREVELKFDPRLDDVFYELKTLNAAQTFKADPLNEGRLSISLEEQGNSRFNTLRALRIMKYWKKL